MGILQQQPLAICPGCGHKVVGNYLLPLAHGDTHCADLLAFCQVLYELCGVRACSRTASVGIELHVPWEDRMLSPNLAPKLGNSNTAIFPMNGIVCLDFAGGL